MAASHMIEEEVPEEVPQLHSNGLDSSEANLPSPQSIYESRCEHFLHDEVECTARYNRAANLRLVAFSIAAACAAWAISGGPLMAWGAAALALLGFAALVRHHASVSLLRERSRRLGDLNTLAINRLHRGWQAIPLRHAFPADRAHPYAIDLTLFGEASLLHLLDTTATNMGQQTLRRWLLNGAAPPEVVERQAAVRELADRLDFCQELQVRGGLANADNITPDPEPFLRWVEGGTWLSVRRPLIWLARTSPVALCALFAAQMGGLLPSPIWLLPLALNIVLWQAAGKRAHDTLLRVATQEGAYRLYADMFALVSECSFRSPLLQRLQQALERAGMPAYRHMRHLQWLAQFILPRSALMYWVVQRLFLWDLHVLTALERWQTRVGPSARVWLKVLGEIEALAAFGGLAHDNPEWTFPEIDANFSIVAARQVGHPLLSPSTRVDNDITVGPVGTFLLVTGSNMAGKTTLLRTLGTNIVLAQAGAPVCATEFRCPPVTLWTSMRPADSLTDGVSTFLAEVLRIKQVLQGTPDREQRGGQILFFLFDEIFQGTNTAERQIAARHVIRHLLGGSATGAISTHDLTLAQSPALAPLARCVHLRETVVVNDGQPTMEFDYLVRPGLATSTNAVRLMEAVGIPIESEDEESGAG